jgi:uncharacterized protein DUF559
VPTPPVPPRVHRPTDRRRARAEGISDWQLRHREVARTSRDTYLLRAHAGELRGRLDAVLLGAPSSAVVSHLSAAAIWGFEVPLVPDDGRVHLTVPRRGRVRSRADRVAGGRFLGRVDLAWPEQRVAVEFDGEVHRDRRIFVDDLRRQNGLVLAGWTVLRFTSADVLGLPEAVVRVARGALVLT